MRNLSLGSSAMSSALCTLTLNGVALTRSPLTLVHYKCRLRPHAPLASTSTHQLEEIMCGNLVGALCQIHDYAIGPPVKWLSKAGPPSSKYGYMLSVRQTVKMGTPSGSKNNTVICELPRRGKEGVGVARASSRRCCRRRKRD